MQQVPERTSVRYASDAVVRAVSIVSGVDAVDFDVPLFRAVDPDALDRLFETGSTCLGSVSFQYDGYNIEIRDDLTVIVDGHAVDPETESS